jgi:hypothetical protein
MRENWQHKKNGSVCVVFVWACVGRRVVVAQLLRLVLIQHHSCQVGPGDARKTTNDTPGDQAKIMNGDPRVTGDVSTFMRATLAKVLNHGR